MKTAYPPFEDTGAGRSITRPRPILPDPHVPLADEQVFTPEEIIERQAGVILGLEMRVQGLVGMLAGTWLFVALVFAVYLAVSK